VGIGKGPIRSPLMISALSVTRRGGGCKCVLMVGGGNNICPIGCEINLEIRRFSGGNGIEIYYTIKRKFLHRSQEICFCSFYFSVSQGNKCFYSAKVRFGFHNSFVF
jgi:hypothetical protein